MITLALAGKPNCGKSTFFTAATMAHAEIAAYPFTTIEANQGVAYVRTTCPCREFGMECGNCLDGNRFIPAGMIDVAGLVPDAHKGKGLGNQFLDDLRQADAIIHIVDASGGTDSEGNPVEKGSHDPRGDIAFLRHEMAMWVYGILEKHWPKIQRQAGQRDFSVTDAIAEVFAGLGITAVEVRSAELRLDRDLRKCDEEGMIAFSRHLVEISKPMMIVGNKADEAPPECLEVLKECGAGFASALSELALRKAAEGGYVSYLPGDPEFTVTNEEALAPAQKAGLATLGEVMEKFGGTGVQQAIDEAVFSMLDMITVYPVEDEHKMTDSQGRILPDAYLMKRGSTPHDLAYRVHSDIGEGFLYAIDARKGMRIKESQVLEDGDIIKIVSTAK